MDITDADQDSDSGYTTNHPDIVEHARKCYLNYPTIVNNIPKDKNSYKNTMDDYAAIDNALANSQLDIGESSNLAQIAQTYACNFPDQKYIDYVCILSVVAQASIDSAKRRFDINIGGEIKRIKKDMDIKTHKYPAFWKIIRVGFNDSLVNESLTCPMNYLHNLEIPKFKNLESTLPMSYFFKKYEISKNDIRRRSMKVEAFISEYSLKVYDAIESNATRENDRYLLSRKDFDEMIQNIRKINISHNYIGLFSWLIDRAFMITAGQNRNQNMTISTINKNKSILLKTLFILNKQNLLQIFSKNI